MESKESDGASPELGESSAPSHEVESTLKNLPDNPGVYLMKSFSGAAIYIGKAKSLKNRVRSYFQKSAAHTARIKIMVTQVAAIDYVETGSEIEALILENNLIKKHRPRYNILLKDDKNYPYIKLTTSEQFPRLILVRRPRNDNDEYFGPFVSAKSVRETIKLIHRLFPLRQSKDNLDGKPARRPCLNYQMGRCLAPCAGLVTRDDYAGLVRDVTLFLRGKDKELVADLKSKMASAAENRDYELAAKYRDRIDAVEHVLEKQKITSTGFEEEDIVACHVSGGIAAVRVFFIRQGRMEGDREFVFRNVTGMEADEITASFMKQFYVEGQHVPAEILSTVRIGDEEHGAIEMYLTRKRGSKVRYHVPERGRKLALVKMAADNARTLWLRSQPGRPEDALDKIALDEIKTALNLPGVPNRIECFDISSIFGVTAVGSMAVFTNGKPDKKSYRRFKIKTVRGSDDYAMLREVVTRRYVRLIAEKLDPPDLVLIDGGKGHLSAALEALKTAGAEFLPVASIAKGQDRNNPKTDEAYIPGLPDPVMFAPESLGKPMLQRLRDEAHRFAIEYHRKTRSAEGIKSVLDEIQGVGPKRKKILLRMFGDVAGIRQASIEEIRQAIKCDLKTAARILESL